MNRPRSGSDMSSNEDDDDAPPTLFVRPSSMKRTVRAPSPIKKPNSSRTQAPRSPVNAQRKQFTPQLVEEDESAIILPPSDWKPPQAHSAPPVEHRPQKLSSVPPASPARSIRHSSPSKASPPRASRIEASLQQTSPIQAAFSRKNESPQKNAPAPHETISPRKGRFSPPRLTASPQKSAFSTKSKSPRKLRFASPEVSPNESLPSSPNSLLHNAELRRTPSSPGHYVDQESQGRESQGQETQGSDAIIEDTASEGPKLTKVPNLKPQAQFDGSSSPYGAQRSPEKNTVLSPERPLTMQVHYLMAREHDNVNDSSHANDEETLADELALFGNRLDASLSPQQASIDSVKSLESVEAPVIWKAIKDLHARGHKLLGDVLKQREQRVSLDDLPGGYSRFSALERQGVESAIVERQKERCLTLRARATEVQQYYIELRDRVWALERQKSEADLLEAQISASASDLEETEALEAQVEAEEANVRELETQIEMAEADWQTQQEDLVSLIAENKASLDQLSAWVLDGKLSEREKHIEKAATRSRQRLGELQRELKLSISLRNNSEQFVYVTAEHLGIVIDLKTQQYHFDLRHRGTPIYKHYLRLLESSTEPLRDRILIWHEGLEAQKAINALARFGIGVYETDKDTLIYKQRLFRPTGELIVRFNGSHQVVDAMIDGFKLEDEIESKDASMDDDVKPPRLTLNSVIKGLQTASRV